MSSAISHLRGCGNTQQNLFFAGCGRCTNMSANWTDSQSGQALVTHNTKEEPNLILTIIKFHSSFFYNCDCLLCLFLLCLIVDHNKKVFLLYMMTATHCKGLQHMESQLPVNFRNAEVMTYRIRL